MTFQEEYDIITVDVKSKEMDEVSMFDNYITFNFEEGVPYVSITKNGVTFNKAVIMKLGYPEHVVLLINSAEKIIAIKSCQAEAPNSTTFYKENPKGILSVRWNAKDLLNTLQDITSWDLSQDAFRIDGCLVKEENAMIFDLKSAKKLS